MKRYIFIIFLFIFCCPSFAQGVIGAGGQGAGYPINTVSAIPLPAGTWVGSVRADYTRFQTFNDQQLIDFRKAGLLNTVLSFDYGTSYFLNLMYAPTNDFIIGFALPFTKISDIRAGVELDDQLTALSLGDAEGVGDLTVYGLWNFMEDKSKDIFTSIFFGADAPVGTSNLLSAAGPLLPEPSTGAWSPFVGLLASQKFKKFSINGNLFYTKTFSGTADINRGDYWNYNLAIVGTLDGMPSQIVVNPALELNGRYSQKTTVSGVVFPNSGGNVMLLSPGLRATFKNSISSYVGVGFPIQQSLYGHQSAVKCAAVAGIDIIFK
jgi:hypothetical protein